MNTIKFNAYIYHNLKNPIRINNISIKNIISNDPTKNILDEINIDHDANYIFQNDLEYYLSSDKIDKKLSTNKLTVYKDLEITETDFKSVFAEAEIAEYTFDRGLKIKIMLNEDVTAFKFYEEPENEESQLMSDFYHDFPEDKEYTSTDGIIETLNLFLQKLQFKLSIDYQAEELSGFEHNPNLNGKHYHDAMKEQFLLKRQEYNQKVEKLKTMEKDYLKLLSSVTII